MQIYTHTNICCTYMQIYTHSVRINEISGHVNFRSAGSTTKGVLETGNIKKKQSNDNVKNKQPNNS